MEERAGGIITSTNIVEQLLISLSFLLCSEFPVSDSDDADGAPVQLDTNSGEAVVCSEEEQRVENGEGT